MKRISQLILFLILVVCMICPAFAAEADKGDATYSVEYFEDGTYCVSVIEDEDTLQTRSTTSTTKSKTSTCYSSSNKKLWYIKVTGTFTYGNGTSKCTSSTVSADTYSNNWKITNKSASKSGATATATATCKLYEGFIVVSSKTKTVSLTCDSKGNFS